MSLESTVQCIAQQRAHLLEALLHLIDPHCFMQFFFLNKHTSQHPKNNQGHMISWKYRVYQNEMSCHRSQSMLETTC